MVLEISRDDRIPSDTEEEHDRAGLPLIEHAIKVMLGDGEEEKRADGEEAASHCEGGLRAVAELDGSRGDIKEVGVEAEAIQENSLRLREMVGMDDVIEAAALDNRNFIRVMVGDEPYLALLDAGATISLVGPRILNKY